ncbi:MAG: pilus assembly protein [Candidatus Nitricoxidivorans perseverans]|uniref:Pilus assembly protein n=1 Tax=Candidatus Nitricoxidivorans perseverans TaxID=2975601 RepID=A0AA49FM36_9PROT|nr:MAG: pilus assembly protein [Candidatus Nitricoxidivorans perseverans]
MFKSDKRSKLKAIVLAVSLVALPLGGQAAGLGKLTVLSPLGQPLQAELELTASREELSSLSARVASAEAFRQVGIEFAPVVASIRFVLDKRPDGQPFLRVISDRPVNDPFLDLLVELNWSSGRMVREYTFLLDPPEILQVPPPPVAMPEVKSEPAVAVPSAPAVPAGKVPELRATAPIDEKLLPKKTKAEEAMPADKPGGDEAASAVRVVKRGDTLGRIAAETRPAGVSLDQMLIALFSRNKDIFDGANMNRLRAGKILSIPDAEAAKAVEPGEARKIIVAHAADFDAYRKKLAAAAAIAELVREEAPPRQAVAGKIAPRVEEKVVPAPGKDKLEVSRTEVPKGAKDAGGRVAALEEDLVARNKALKEAGGRIAELEKNLGDLKKLAELKSQQGAELQKQAQAPAPEMKEPEPAPKKPPVAKQPSPPPGFIEENPELAFGGGGILLLLLGYLGYSVWRRKRGGSDMGPTSRITESELTSNSVFGSTGGQSVDTGASLQSDFSQAGAAAIDADEGVDPVAEADVYMAYGRDAQAEEILIDALKNDPTRHAIHLKLLEIYAARKSLKQFETLAGDIYGHTGGAGPDWEKAATMGRSLDPENPLYGGQPASPGGRVPADFGSTTIVVPPSEADKVRDTVTMPGELAQLTAAAVPPSVAPPPEETSAALDFDLDLGAPPESAAEAPSQSIEEVASLDFDLDLGASIEPTAPAAAAPAVESSGLDIDLELSETDSGKTIFPVETGAPVAGGDSIDFNFDLGEAVAAPIEEPAALPLDISAISLDLGGPGESHEAAEAESSSAPARELAAEPGISKAMGIAAGAPVSLVAEEEPAAQDNSEVATKLELAQAYEEMGDNDGARELLQEVLSEGSPRQQEIARAKLARLEG